MSRFPYALLLLAAVACTARAMTVYKMVQPDGTVVYSDQPQPGAKKMDVQPAQTYQAPPLPAPVAPQQPPTPAKTFQGYKKFVVSSPGQDATLRDNQGNVSISLELQPALQPGNEIQIIMDGKPLGTGRSTSISLTNVDRGAHTVQAKVLDASGKTLATTPPVTFYLHHTSVLLSPAFKHDTETAKADTGAGEKDRQ